MGKRYIELDSGALINPLTLVKANLAQFQEMVRKMIQEVRDQPIIDRVFITSQGNLSQDRHKSDLIQLSNLIYCLVLDLQDVEIDDPDVSYI